MDALVARFFYNRSGATSIEYAMIALILGVGIIAGVTDLRTALSALYDRIVGAYPQ